MSSEIVHEQSSQLIVVKPISRATVILGVREKSGTTDEHTAYKIVCEKPGGSRYVVLKRFSDFYRLRTAVTKTLGRIDPGIKTIIGHALYAFPKRRYFNNLSDEVVSERVLALNTFLSLLLEELPSPNAIEPLLGDFLMPQMDTDTVKAMQRTSDFQRVVYHK